MKKRGRDLFHKYKRILYILAAFISCFPLKLRKKLFENARYSRGMYGIVIRYILFKSIAEKCGDNVLIAQGCFILSPEKISAGDNVSIQPMCYVDAAGGIVIENNVSIAHAVTILSSTHNYSSLDLPIKDQGMTYLPTVIKENVWIGAKATILGGTIIEAGSVIGATAVVTKNTEHNSVVAGVPAKIIKMRT